MAITKLTVENFKSFDKLEVELRPFNIVVGSNASGKSNFLDIFRFLRDIANDSLENAIGIRGGAETLSNFNLSENQLLRICVETDEIQRHLVHHRDGEAIGIKTDRTVYELSILCDESDEGFKVATDNLAEHFTVLDIRPADDREEKGTSRWGSPPSLPSFIGSGSYVEQQKRGSGRTVFHRESDSIKCYLELPEGVPFSEEEVSTMHGLRLPLHRPQEVLLEPFLRRTLLPYAAHSLTNVFAYDFDPRRPRQAVPIIGPKMLEPDASNLAVVLREILRRPDWKNSLINLVSTLMPFVHDLEVDEYGFGQLITTLTERFSDTGHRLPAVFASDGTIACLALVVALYFQQSSVAVFEEPDRYIHPHLAGQVMQMMNEVTDRTQIIITTHNPELLRHANLEDILLVTRDSDGHSQITRPADSEVVSHFLQNELGVEDLFVQNLLDL